MRRVLPAIGLFFIAPLVAEYLLGDFSIKKLGLLVFLAPMYGGGALLIREVTRRTGRGWPTIIVLALAYGVLEEAYTTQSLFNPDFLNKHLELLKPAYLPALGISAWWTIFVLTLHTVWSISVSIGLAESLVPDRATTPWLKNLGLSIITVLFIAVCIAATLNSIHTDKVHFMATQTQFAIAGIICILLIVIAFLLPKRGTPISSSRAPSPWLVGALAVITGSIFMFTPKNWAWRAVAIYIVLYVIVIIPVAIWSRRSGWDGRHRLALAGGAALAYGVHSFAAVPVMEPAGIFFRISNAVLLTALIILLAIAARKNQAFVDNHQAS
jgi:hypothetical protein